MSFRVQRYYDFGKRITSFSANAFREALAGVKEDENMYAYLDRVESLGRRAQRLENFANSIMWYQSPCRKLSLIAGKLSNFNEYWFVKSIQAEYRD